MQYALVDANNIVQNFIAYDPSLPHGPYTPPDGMTVQQVNDWCQIGEPVTMAEPDYAAAQAKVLAGHAKLALDATDTVASRCFKAGVPFPAEWQKYTDALRSIAAGGAGPLPARPAYPAGT